ncbi:hypothetical protein JRQ81_004130 [Phrynocephalus forsythii]|uniref:Uncharacterized protein n=1 Tax=Phrynocephalus forsythii TaxID=171643 RepID=A0A9Q1AYC3_9SAUR|nr:hypothetical protein JRQ81_004130 [Phrynocephalus forsythii]
MKEKVRHGGRGRDWSGRASEEELSVPLEETVVLFSARINPLVSQGLVRGWQVSALAGAQVALGI